MFSRADLRLASQSLDTLARKRTVRSYRAGQCILTQGAVPEFYYCTASGSVDAIHYDRMGEQRLVLRIRRQTLFPHLPFLRFLPRPVSFLARSNVVLCAFPAEAISSVYASDPHFRDIMIETLGERFRALTERTLMLLSVKAIQKVAGAIFALRDQGDACAATNSEISEWTGLANETVSRCISELVRKKLVRKAEKRLVIVDLERLRSFIGV
jgi:CRP-like cAMP-binding protein